MNAKVKNHAKIMAHVQTAMDHTHVHVKTDGWANIVRQVKKYNLVYIEHYNRDTSLNQAVIVISSGCLSKEHKICNFWVIL